MTDSDAAKPRPPAGLKATGRTLWESITMSWELDPHELSLLRELVRIADTLDDLDTIVRREGPIVEGSHGGQKAHPALVERRQQAITFARLDAVLRLPTGDEADEKTVKASGRGQRRAGARGVYPIRGAM